MKEKTPHSTRQNISAEESSTIHHVTQIGHIEHYHESSLSAVERFFYNLLPPFTSVSPISVPLKNFLFGTIIVVGFSIFYYWGNGEIKVMGLATEENGKVKDGLFIIVFVDGFEINRVVSHETEWNGKVPTSKDLNRGANFELSIPNVFGYSAKPLDISVFIPARDLRANIMKSYITPSNQQLQIVALDPQETDVDLAHPLYIQDNGDIVAISENSQLYSLEERMNRITGQMSIVDQTKIWYRVLLGGAFATVLGISSNVIASFLQERYSLINNTRRFTIVCVIFIISLFITLFV